MFSAIGPWVEDANVLDLFAGSGSYGLEALSRGAATATFVEKGRRALEALRANIATVGLGGSVVAQDVERFLSAPGPRRYHVVFIDPPWDLSGDVLASHLGVVDTLLEEDGEVVISRRHKDDAPNPPPRWTVATDRRYGDARIHRYAKTPDSRKA